MIGRAESRLPSVQGALVLYGSELSCEFFLSSSFPIFCLLTSFLVHYTLLLNPLTFYQFALVQGASLRKWFL